MITTIKRLTTTAIKTITIATVIIFIMEATVKIMIAKVGRTSISDVSWFLGK